MGKRPLSERLIDSIVNSLKQDDANRATVEYAVENNYKRQTTELVETPTDNPIIANEDAIKSKKLVNPVPSPKLTNEKGIKSTNNDV
eukprot:CAMPEP_0185750744 /NCGR_PEP_ID=MMETSP1174-20130828/9520_1 /TAXON_ID=35687 /ORGANISM="Dictyocha speculum, Strain CCMP1381" /LENGTH=86 /DNA_ID=CAMNT_0028427397 /DNA_START=547 /DNA_END=807 /DNA_ORIENTATION=+